MPELPEDQVTPPLAKRHESVKANWTLLRAGIETAGGTILRGVPCLSLIVIVIAPL